MQASVAFQDEQLELELAGEALLGSWPGPGGLAPDDVATMVRDALEAPLDYPPVRQLVVPGDRLTLALDPALPAARTVLKPLLEILAESGVELSDMTLVVPPGRRSRHDLGLPPEVALAVHDPADSSRVAYLAATKEGRRIYLNRHLTDADVALPLGLLGCDPLLGYRGPWSVLFPGLSDAGTQASLRRSLPDDPWNRPSPRAHLDEPLEVSWLLGTQFHLGIVPGRTGIAEVVGGLAESVRDRGIAAVERLWSFRSPEAADCVVVGIGGPGEPCGLDELVEGLVTGARLVNHGGRIVALSRAQGCPGPSLQRLMSLEDMKQAPAALKAHDDDADSVAGRRLARVLSWADVYLLSGLDRQVVEDLSMVHLERPDEARRLVARSNSCIVVNRAELTRASVVRNPEA